MLFDSIYLIPVLGKFFVIDFCVKVVFLVFILEVLLGVMYYRALLASLRCISMKQNYKVPFLKWLLILVIFFSHRFSTALGNLHLINCSYILSNKC